MDTTTATVSTQLLHHIDTNCPHSKHQLILVRDSRVNDQQKHLLIIFMTWFKERKPISSSMTPFIYPLLKQIATRSRSKLEQYLSENIFFEKMIFFFKKINLATSTDNNRNHQP